ncbi:MAG: SRPBCC family protein [Nostocoides sp.]
MTSTTNALALDVPAGAPWIDFTRDFDAPLAALFEAHRDPEIVKQWLGPDGYRMEIDEYTFESGGKYRYTHHSPDHGSFSFHGLFHTVRTNEFAIQTFEFEGMPDEVTIEFLWFEDLGGGRSRLRGRTVGRTVEARDAMVESGMESGMAQGYDRLEQIVTSN